MSIHPFLSPSSPLAPPHRPSRPLFISPFVLLLVQVQCQNKQTTMGIILYAYAQGKTKKCKPSDQGSLSLSRSCFLALFLILSSCHSFLLHSHYLSSFPSFCIFPFTVDDLPYDENDHPHNTHTHTNTQQQLLPLLFTKIMTTPIDPKTERDNGRT